MKDLHYEEQILTDNLHAHAVEQDVCKWFLGIIIFANKYLKQAGAELCQAQVKLG